MGLSTAAWSRCAYRVSRLSGSRPRPGKGSGPYILGWLLAAAIAPGVMAGGPGGTSVVYPAGTPTLGARFTSDGTAVKFRVFSSRATRIEVAAFSSPSGQGEKVSVPMTKDAGTNVWSVTIPLADLRAKGIDKTIYYGYRAWGPNWPFDAAWKAGTGAGFVTDVDGQGNRFNPNKLLLDPYALEVSHDPVNDANRDGTIYASGPAHRFHDTALVAPKAIVLKPEATRVGNRPERPFKDEIVYEVHLRGLTRADESVPEKLRGTYAGAALKARYLKDLGVTAVEFLPVHETPNDQNDLDPNSDDGDNYWGYSNYNYFSPDRRYSSDTSPGGPTREFKAMVKAFHDQGLKVYLDVVFNHTGEGGLYGADKPDVANILCYRGLDNPTYYELSGDARFYYDNTGVGGNFNTADPVVRNLVVDSLQYWTKVMGVDGFRFDLAPVLGNDKERDGFEFDKLEAANPLNRLVRELPVRPAKGGPGADLIAEPWAIGTFQLGDFPAGWAEWNGRFRDTIRRSQNKLDVENETPGEIARAVHGLVRPVPGRRPQAVALGQLHRRPRRLHAPRPVRLQRQAERPAVAEGPFGRRDRRQPVVGPGRRQDPPAAGCPQRPGRPCCSPPESP